MKIGYYRRGSQKIDGDAIWMSNVDPSQDVDISRPVANPDILFPKIMTEYHDLRDRVLLVDPVRFRRLDEAVEKASEDIKDKVAIAALDDSEHKVRFIDMFLETGQAGSAIFDDWDGVTLAIVSPFMLKESLLSPGTFQTGHLPFLQGITPLSPRLLVAESILTACHEIGHVDEIDKKLKDPELENSVLRDSLDSVFMNHDNFVKYANVIDRLNSELYADAAAVRVGHKFMDKTDFIDASLMMLDSRSLDVMGRFATWRVDEDATADFSYATSLIWHHALRDIGTPALAEKTPHQRVIEATPKMSELEECYKLYGDTVIQSTFLHDFHGASVSVDFMIRRIGEQGQKATTRFAAVIGRDTLSAMNRRLYEGSFDPEIMEKAMTQIHQSPGAQQYFDQYPDPDVTASASLVRKWRHGRQVAPRPEELGKIRKL